jgi:hypothetical protein
MADAQVFEAVGNSVADFAAYHKRDKQTAADLFRMLGIQAVDLTE